MLLLERERIQRNFISSFLNSDDIEVFSSKEIERGHVRCYSDLFSSESVDACCKQACLASVEKHLCVSQQQSCEGFLSLQELSDSVKGLNLFFFFFFFLFVTNTTITTQVKKKKTYRK